MTLILILSFFIILNSVLFYKHKLLAKINNIYDIQTTEEKFINYQPLLLEV